jgi:hypothetical protein
VFKFEYSGEGGAEADPGGEGFAGSRGKLKGLRSFEMEGRH